MTLPTLPDGARLALMNWPGGRQSAARIVDSLPRRDGPLWTYGEVVRPLLDAGLIETVATQFQIHTYRLTQAGRKAMDVLQSGVE